MDSVTRFLILSLFHDSNPSGPLINMLKYFCMKFLFCGDIRLSKKIQRRHWNRGFIKGFCNFKKGFFSNLKRRFHEISATIFHDSNSFSTLDSWAKYFWGEVQGFKDISLFVLKRKEMDYHCIEKPYILFLVQYWANLAWMFIYVPNH